MLGFSRLFTLFLITSTKKGVHFFDARPIYKELIGPYFIATLTPATTYVPAGMPSYTFLPSAIVCACNVNVQSNSIAVNNVLMRILFNCLFMSVAVLCKQC